MRNSARSGLTGPLVTVLVTVVAAALAVVTTAAPAAAHAEFESSTPAAGDTLTKLPETVTVAFTEPVRTPAFVEVTGPDKTALTSGEARVRDTDIVAQVEESAGPGQYTLAYRVTSADGHPITGTVRFAVQGGAAAGDQAPRTDTATTAGAAATDGSGGGMGTTTLLLLLGALAIGLLALAGGTRAALRRAVTMVDDGPAGRSRSR